MVLQWFCDVKRRWAINSKHEFILPIPLCLICLLKSINSLLCKGRAFIVTLLMICVAYAMRKSYTCLHSVLKSNTNRAIENRLLNQIYYFIGKNLRYPMALWNNLVNSDSQWWWIQMTHLYKKTLINLFNNYWLPNTLGEKKNNVGLIYTVKTKESHQKPMWKKLAMCNGTIYHRVVGTSLFHQALQERGKRGLKQN